MMCINVIGSFTCDCKDGYEQYLNGSCIGEIIIASIITYNNYYYAY